MTSFQPDIHALPYPCIINVAIHVCISKLSVKFRPKAGDKFRNKTSTGYKQLEMDAL